MDAMNMDLSRSSSRELDVRLFQFPVRPFSVRDVQADHDEPFFLASVIRHLPGIPGNYPGGSILCPDIGLEVIEVVIPGDDPGDGAGNFPPVFPVGIEFLPDIRTPENCICRIATDPFSSPVPDKDPAGSIEHREPDVRVLDDALLDLACPVECIRARASLLGQVSDKGRDTDEHDRPGKLPLQR